MSASCTKLGSLRCLHLPSALLCLSFLTGDLAGAFYAGQNRDVLVITALAAGPLALGLASPVALAGAGFSAGVACAASVKAWESHDSLGKLFPDGGRHTLSGIVRQVSPGRFGSRIMFEVDRTDEMAPGTVRFGAVLRFSGVGVPAPGDRIRARCRLQPDSSGDSTGKITVTVTAWQALASGGRANIARNRLIEAFDATGGDRHGVFRALCTGDRTRISAPLSLALSRTGTGHLMAVSGLHLSAAMAAGALPVLLITGSIVRRNRRSGAAAAAGLVVLIPAVLYLQVVGLRGSSSRALLFALIFLLSALWSRRVDHAACLMCGLLALAALSPGRLPGQSLTLSLMAYAGIARASGEAKGGLRLPAGWLGISMAASLFTLPLTVWLLGGVPLTGPLFSLLMVPVFGVLVIPASVLTVLWAYAGWPGAALLVQTGGAITDALAGLLIMSSKWGLFIHLNGSGCLIAALTALALAAGYMIFGGGRKTLLACLLLAAVAGWAAGQAYQVLDRSRLEVVFPPVGQAGAAIIRAGGLTVLVDCGPPWSGGRNPVVAALKKRGTTSVDGVFLSHPHPDHTGGLDAISLRYPIRRIFRHRNWGLLAVPGLARQPLSLATGSMVRFKDMEFSVLGPAPGTAAGDLNRGSMQLLLSWHGYRILFTGDAGWDQVAGVLKGIGKVDVLVMPHHGSANGFVPRVMEKTLGRMTGGGPAVVVCPSPPPGQRVLPSIQVVTWFRRYGRNPLFSGKHGGISLFFK